VVSVGQAIAALEELWPANTAEEWDRPGLVVGNLETEVTGILLSVDLTESVFAEAKQLGANLIVTHHPYLLRGVSSIAQSTAKGALLSKLVKADVASFAAHTNADVALDGVSASIAATLGLDDVVALTDGGHGRVGNLPEPKTASEVVSLLLEHLPKTVRGVSCSASEDLLVSRVALCGGAGDSFIEDAKLSGADIYITSDLRHHVAQDAGLPLIDVSHWASESLWLPLAAKSISSRLPLPIHVSRENTDPWIFRRNIEGDS
jgi:dinuclear metal center YbgI/SA1388 family protein